MKSSCKAELVGRVQVKQFYKKKKKKKSEYLKLARGVTIVWYVQGECVPGTPQEMQDPSDQLCLQELKSCIKLMSKLLMTHCGRCSL